MSAFPRRRRLVALGLLALAACVPVPYQARELDATAAAADYVARRVDQPGLARFAARSGYAGTWPPEQWSFAELALVALYFDPHVRSARAQTDVTRAELALAGTREGMSLTPVIEHHSRQLDDAPWSVGVALELPWVARTRREARRARAVALADAAELDVARSVWQSRARLRDALIELTDSRRRLTVLEAALSARRDMRNLVARRVEAGMLSARELAQEEAALGEVEATVELERGRLRAARAAMAGSLGIAPEVFARMTVADSPLGDAAPPMTPAEVRAAALRNRLDVHRRLLEFGAADAELRLAVAAQYPDLAAAPAYLWDQGDSVWSLAARIAFPASARAAATVRRAEAARELAARRFIELQHEVIAQAERASARLVSALAQREAAARQAAAARARLQRAQTLFERGVADRLELTAARLVAGASADGEREAQSAVLRALAALEDTTQAPLLGADATLHAATGHRIAR
ncbi:MAG TPA: TolC family protein [Burkholderiales bacterium]|jgi:cobalt-zinc-cadmium efflux system outer membrane protein|nr:TolC family protein [Burkholderiales bacterium]